MVTRTNSQQVVFRRPFLLSGFDALQVAGAYTVDTEEELIEALSFPVWKRVATMMQFARDGATGICTGRSRRIARSADA
ncbi:MAG: hypothetical protein KGI68_06275 [Alphaproteobacteria bacterium]|nr:hypothetical protein [Alphaproteobacteria bacterium]MDE2499283.1 hypothetical protein [Alphaproteobacteria bacterium]